MWQEKQPLWKKNLRPPHWTQQYSITLWVVHMQKKMGPSVVNIGGYLWQYIVSSGSLFYSICTVVDTSKTPPFHNSLSFKASYQRHNSYIAIWISLHFETNVNLTPYFFGWRRSLKMQGPPYLHVMSFPVGLISRCIYVPALDLVWWLPPRSAAVCKRFFRQSCVSACSLSGSSWRVTWPLRTATIKKECMQISTKNVQWLAPV